ncbi:hypothetical protein GUJ93_ZPchr0005g14857 [Zizania palustris]|uniref:Uncharacterized protein n=1 Tax=Zizania palustris TaxID=103762 RepID=A0A8J5SFB3_ZIZPA|nr:hypothetical protein GUJ93_ZPchr0005g14857 [Zizania palustris]
MAAAAAGKKVRKPYTITRPRERWSGAEHGRFLDALLLFGRDWKRIQEFVGTKTAIQIRSHAQKHFLKARKFGLAGDLPPPLHPHRAGAGAMQQQQQQSLEWPSFSSPQAFLQDESILLPISPDEVGFAQVYRFVGDVFGSGAPWAVEAHLQRLHGMDPAVAETILRVLRNLEANLAA